MREWTFTLPNELPFWKLESQWTSKSSEGDCRGENPSDWRILHIIEKLLKRRCLKMGSHDPFEHLKHKLWPKKRLGVKLAVWLQITKSQESTRFPREHVACDIVSKKSWWRLQLSLNLISIRGLHTKLWGPKVPRIPTLGISGLPFGNFETKCHLDVGLVERHKNTIRGGRWWLPPSLGHGESCESEFGCGLSYHQKCSTYAITNLLFGLYRFVWLNACHSSYSHTEAPACPFTPKVLRAKERALTLCPSVVFISNSHLNPSKSLGVFHKGTLLSPPPP